MHVGVTPGVYANVRIRSEGLTEDVRVVDDVRADEEAAEAARDE